MKPQGNDYGLKTCPTVPIHAWCGSEKWQHFQILLKFNKNI
jgi:hypothetical protein